MNYAIVTGALGGIGRATAELLLSRGWGVVGMDLPEHPDLSGFSEHFTYIPGDLSAAADRERLVALPRALTHWSMLRASRRAFAQTCWR